MSDPGIDVAEIERQLADLSVPGGEAVEVLLRLAETIFPGRTAIGDPARILWPERWSQAPQASRTGLTRPEQLEAQITKSDARFRSLVEQLPAVVFYAALGDEDNEIYVSPQVEALLGFTQEEWLTNPLLWYSQLHPDDHEAVTAAFTQGVQTGGPFRAEVRFLSRDGEEVWILGEARLIRDAAQRPAYFQGVAFDITPAKRAQDVMAQAERAKAEAAQARADAFAARNIELVELNEQLRLARDEAEAAALARSTFLTTMSHELRTPLNSVIVLAGLLADDELTAGQRDMVRRMRLASDHLLELINDVLEFSRLRAGQVEVEWQTFELETWLNDTLDIAVPRAVEKGLEVRAGIAAGIPHRITADQGRLRQILLNLVGNAVKFTSEGHVDVTVTGRPLDGGDGPEQWELQCSVRDTGVGVRPDAIATLFDEFRQADSGVSREYGGTGLGLAICKRLCELLGGRIWVEGDEGDESDEGDEGGEATTVKGTPVNGSPVNGTPGGARSGDARSGATFTFTWVASVGAEVEVPRPQVLSPARQSGGLAALTRPLQRFLPRRPDDHALLHRPPEKLRVLLVDDDPMNREVALLLLGAMGHRADVAASGSEAIAAAVRQPYDVVLMDVSMPATDGLSATRCIRGLGSAIRQPYIVAVTANALPGDSERCMAAGMDDYVTKPIDRGELSRALAAGRKPRSGPVEATPEPEPASFDRSVPLRILGEFGPEPLRRLIGIFRAQAPTLADAAVAAAAAGDANQTERNVHTLKSSAANMGGTALALMCAEIEARARAGQLDGIESLAQALSGQVSAVLEQLGALEASLPPVPA